MKKLLWILPVLFFMAFNKQQKNKVVFFGDSITEMGAKPGGYIRKIDSLCRLENKSAGYEFLGAGISGNKIYDLYLRMQEDVLNLNPQTVVIYIGVNDVWHKASLGTGTDADKFEKFYAAVIKRLKEKNIRIILATPAVVGEKTDFTNQLDGDLNRYSAIIRNLAKANNLLLVDLRQRFLDYNKANNPQNMEKGILTYDRVHLNDSGNQLVAEEFWKAIKSTP